MPLYFQIQKHCNCATEAGLAIGEDRWKLILPGFRFTSDLKSQYVTAVEEALALVYRLEACRMFVLGCLELLVKVDHKPLKNFLDKALEDMMNTRLFSLKERSLMYKFRIKHLPGKLNAAPDCRWRHSGTSRQSGAIEKDIARIINSYIIASFSSTYMLDPKWRAITWDQIVTAAPTDENCRSLAKCIQMASPSLGLKEALYCLEGVIIMDNKILIPKKLRSEVLESLRAAYQSVNGMLANARQLLFWPGLDVSIRQTRS